MVVSTSTNQIFDSIQMFREYYLSLLSHIYVINPTADPLHETIEQY